MDRVSAFLETVRKGTDLAAVLCSAAFIDRELAKRIAHVAKPSAVTEEALDPNKGGFLSESKRKADFLYMLGAMDKPSYQAVCKLLEIRNRFGHSPTEKKLDDPDIRTMVDDLAGITASFRRQSAGESVAADPETCPRRRFSASIVPLVLDLTRDAEGHAV